MESTRPTHWIIRVNDGINFSNSIYPFWGVKKRYKSYVKKFKPGDILWFMTSKPFGGKLIGMSEYTGFYDRNDEPLIQINTYTNKDQNWVGDEDWVIQIHYTNLYNTSKQEIKACIQHQNAIFNYETYKNKIDGNLYKHYKGFKFYAEPKEFKI